MATIFFTGFPGFLGTELLPRVLRRRTDASAVCLVQAKFAAVARARADILGERDPALRGRIRLVEGDLTAPGLGLRPGDVDTGEVAEIFHLAAVYDLTVRRDVGLAVNLEGTRHVLDLAAACGRLERFQYVSTCYVSGRHPGLFLESDLEKGQAFHNFYEETKHLAEVEVRARMAKGLPGTIYRPAITVGDSRTGLTQKFDGPYYVFQWILRQGSVAIMPTVGTLQDQVNVVPSDYVVGAIDALSGRSGSLGKTYQLADPRPLTVDALLSHVEQLTGKTVIRVPVPLDLAKGAIDKVPGVHWLMRIPSAALDYFVHPARYDVRQAQADLVGTDVRCPALPEYLPQLIEFQRAHPEISAAAMV